MTDLETLNIALTAQIGVLRSVLLDIAGDPAGMLIEQQIRLQQVRDLAEDLSAKGMSLAMDSPYIVDHVLAGRLDQIGDRLREILDTPVCTCGECGAEE